jgi:hypothetical protein
MTDPKITAPEPQISDGLLPWMAGLAECHQCDNHWAAVWPLFADELECPRCGCTDTERNSYEVY